jgi:hypothetical protein
MIVDADLPEQFLQRIGEIDHNGCWIWKGNLTGRDRRAYIWWKGGTRVAARVLYEYIHRIELPAEIHVLHRCDNPKCVNPDHLYLGTSKDNALDREYKGRNKAFASGFQGIKNGAVRLTEDQVRQIRASNKSTRELYTEYNVSQMTILNIKSRKSWKHLE